jgi:rhodanese-related sulfurtransferase
VSESLQVDPQSAARLIESGAALIDVRAADEYEAGHLAGARHVPLERLSAESAGIERNGPVVFYCRGGERSATAAAAFEESGFDAHSIEGGLVAWAQAGLPLDGTVAERSNLPPA